MKRWLLPLLATLALGAFASPANAEAPLMLASNAIVPLSLHAGDGLMVNGSLRTTFDGTVFDAATRTQGAVTTLGGLYDLAGGGLRIVEMDSVAHVVKLAATGEDAPGCRAAGFAGPCLIPRTASLAHERLLSAEEFENTLVGALEATELRRPEPLVAPKTLKTMIRVFASIGALALALVAIAWMRARRRSPLGQVHEAAREARARTRGDATLAAVGAEIDALVARAVELDGARRANEKKRSKIDRAEIERSKRSWGQSAAPEAAQVCRWLSAESAEADRLDADLSASKAGIEQIATSLRVIALHAREHRGVRVRVGADNPLDTVGRELALRDRAMHESEAAAE
jgi:hypothetical protein